MHAETGQAPIERFAAGGPHRQASPDLIREAFRWSVTRRVTCTATVPLEGNTYAVDPALVGRRVELRYDPEDLTRIEVYLDGKPAGAAVPFVTRRHVHRAVPQAARPDPDPTGVDYLGLVAAHDEEARHWREDRLHPARQAPRQRPRPGGAVSPAPWAAHFGLARTPFGKSIAARDLFARQAHAEAIARISFCGLSALGVVTGDVGHG